ncbi:MAG: cytochrome ubiquinol oxidase subunit I [Thermoprotei archaeon]
MDTFTPVTWMSFMLLGISVLVHVTLVNLVLGFSVIIPFVEYLSYKRKDKELEDVAKRLFRYLVISDLVAGVWGTWITVVLAGLWPTLTYIATTVLFIPITIAIIGILISIPTIAVYWYTWGKISQKVHLTLGVLMAIGALMVPAGFRMIFSFINNPVGLNEALAGNLYAVFNNPIYPAILLKSWFGGLTMSALMAAGIYSLKNSKKLEVKESMKAAKIMIKFGIVFLLVQSIFGVYYFYVLNQDAPYIYSAIVGNTNIAHYNFLPLFLAHIGLVVFMWISALILFVQLRSGSSSRFLSLVLISATFFALPIGEAMNDASRAPYMVISGASGLPANNFANTMFPISWSIAYLAVIVAVIVMVIFAGSLYVIYFGRPVEQPSG